MADINEIYGSNYQQESNEDRMKYAVKLLGTNIANKQFVLRLDSSAMWKDGNMSNDAIKMLLGQVQRTNNKFRITHVSKRSKSVNMFPYLINGNVEYFVITDLSSDKVQIYSVYITPNRMEPF